MRDVKLLVGAPQVTSLDWNAECTVSDFLPAIRRFLASAYTNGGDGQGTTSATALHDSHLPQWRAIHILAEALGDSGVLREMPDSEEGRGSKAADTEALSFLEHSLAVFEGHDSTQNPSALSIGSDTTFGESAFGSLSLMTDASAGLPQSHQDNGGRPLPRTADFTLPSRIVDLRQLPSAAHIRSIYPQTITVNLLVGIISVSPLRQVQVRRFAKGMGILEILVGDETSAAFGLSIWLDPTARESDQGLGSTVMNLGPRDIVCFQNIALSVFRDRVYGQSLSRIISRTETKVHMLGKHGQVVGDKLKEESKGSIEMKKLERVEAWAHEFVCSPGHHHRLASKHLRGRILEQLPPDTQ